MNIKQGKLNWCIVSAFSICRCYNTPNCCSHFLPKKKTASTIAFYFITRYNTHFWPGKKKISTPFQDISRLVVFSMSVAQNKNCHQNHTYEEESYKQIRCSMSVLIMSSFVTHCHMFVAQCWNPTLPMILLKMLGYQFQIVLIMCLCRIIFGGGLS